MTPHTAKLRVKRPPLTPRILWLIFKETVIEWDADKAPRLGAALAFYSMLSIGPLLLISLSVMQSTWGQDVVGHYMLSEIRRLIGAPGEEAIQTLLLNSQTFTKSLSPSLWATIVITLLISCTGFFAQMQDALNVIWNIEGSATHWMAFIRKRLLSFVMIMAIGVLMLAALAVSATLSLIAAMFRHTTEGFVLHTLNLIVSFGVITLLFALIFKVLPDIAIHWGDVWVGSGLTAVLFTLGKVLIAFYLSHSTLSSTYGAAGSLIVVMLWIYYSTLIFFLGAEFTQVYARYMGSTGALKKGRRAVKPTPKL